jgi:hypothetical protein
VPDAVFGAGTRGWFVRTATRKLIVPFEAEAPGSDAHVTLHTVGGESYLPELIDVSAAETALRRDLLARWRLWLDASDEPSPEPADPATIERLRMLGYVR